VTSTPQRQVINHLSESSEMLCSAYEELRRRTLAPEPVLGRELGLTLLLRHGMAHWAERSSTSGYTKPETSSPKPLGEVVVLPAEKAQLVNVIAAMVVNQERSSHDA
jgi:hypothetical protein